LGMDTEIEQALKSVHYQEFPKLIAAMKTEEDNSIKTLKSCEEAKIKATRAMVVNLHTIGRVLLDVEHTQNMIKFLQNGVLQSQPQIQELKKITKLQNTYKESLKEIQRRKAYSQKIEGLYKHHEKYFKTLQENEVTTRLAFQANYGPYLLSQLVPFLVKTEQEERNIPVVQLSLRPFDQDIPDVGQLPVSLEDDFSLISDYESNPKEALKRKEEENAQLLEHIQVLLKQTEEKKSVSCFYQSTNCRTPERGRGHARNHQISRAWYRPQSHPISPRGKQQIIPTSHLSGNPTQTISKRSPNSSKEKPNSLDPNQSTPTTSFSLQWIH